MVYLVSGKSVVLMKLREVKKTRAEGMFRRQCLCYPKLLFLVTSSQNWISPLMYTSIKKILRILKYYKISIKVPIYYQAWVLFINQQKWDSEWEKPRDLINYGDFISNIPIGEVTKFLGSNLLTLIKMILLEKKILVFSDNTSSLSQFMVGIISLLPGNILFNYWNGKEIKNYLRSINRLGLPLKVFNNKTQLLLSASILDLKKLEKAEGYFVGTTNSFLAQNAALKPDLIINIKEKTINFTDKKKHGELIYAIYNVVHSYLRLCIHWVGACLCIV